MRPMKITLEQRYRALGRFGPRGCSEQALLNSAVAHAADECFWG